MSEPITLCDPDSGKDVWFYNSSTLGWNKETVQSKLDKGDLRMVDLLLLSSLAEEGEVNDFCKTLITQEGARVDVPDGAGRNALHWIINRIRNSDDRKQKDACNAGEMVGLALEAASNGQMAQMKELSELTNSQDDKGLTPLHYAALHGADPNIIDHGETAPLSLAAFRGHEKIAGTLLDAGATADARNNIGRSAMHYAAEYDNGNVIREMMKHENKPDVNARDQRGITPLHLACEDPGNKENVSALLMSGADVHAADEQGNTPLHWVCSTSLNADVTKMLIGMDADPSEQNNEGKTPLYKVVEYMSDASGMVSGDEISEHAVDINQKGMHVVDALLAVSPDVNIQDNDGNTGMHNVRDLDLLKRLLDAGGDLEIGNKNGVSAWHVVAKNCVAGLEEKQIVELLGKMADPTDQDKQGRTALQRAVESDNPEILKAYCSYDKSAVINPSEVMDPGLKHGSLMHLAASSGSYRCMRILADAVPELMQVKDQDGNDPLRIASMHGHTKCIDILLPLKFKHQDNAESQEAAPAA